jgi:hypothetical protein
MGHPASVLSLKFLVKIAKGQMQIPVRLRSGQAFDSAEVRFVQDDRAEVGVERRTNADPSTHHPQTEKRLGPLSLRMTGLFMLRALEKRQDTSGAWFGARLVLPKRLSVSEARVEEACCPA